MKEQQLVRLSMIDQKRKVRITANLIEKDDNPKLKKQIDKAKVSLADVILNGGGNKTLVKQINKLEEELEQWIRDHKTPDSIDVNEVAGKVSEFVLDKIKLDSSESNAIRDQIVPFVGQIMSTSMVKVAGLEMAHFLLVSDLVRQTMIFNMTVSFMTYKFLQNHNYQIVTTEEPVSTEEIADLRKVNKEQEQAALAAILGISTEEYAQRAKGGDTPDDDSSPTTH